MGASVKLFGLGVRTPGGGGLFLAYSIDFRRFGTPRLPNFGIILGLLETLKLYKFLF